MGLDLFAPVYTRATMRIVSNTVSMKFLLLCLHFILKYISHHAVRMPPSSQSTCSETRYSPGIQPAQMLARYAALLVRKACSHQHALHLRWWAACM